MAPKSNKKITGKIKLQIQAGKANPSPPIGPALGQHGVNIMDFCKQYNAQTENMVGYVVPVEITVYEDRSFTFITKTPPAAVLIKKALGLEKASPTPNKKKVATSKYLIGLNPWTKEKGGGKKFPFFTIYEHGIKTKNQKLQIELNKAPKYM